ncbi:required for drug-induced death protein 1 isoform X2 [Cololabis saira]|uniref:required for drug-induced death protein 1 isoform X2 n=1 Tax=Cololabis saira TaxID=129043 RepID=UPI002AD22564|nr:required for drug-induced death protein 1 isoform X2 [Cololabis saira]
MKPKSLPSRLFDRNSAAASEETSTSRAAKYQRHVDCMDPPETLNQSSHDDGLQATDDSGRKDKWHRELHFAFLPERYKPLIDDEEKARANREKKKRKKENYKKVKKFFRLLLKSASSFRFKRMLEKRFASPGSV